jgi:hypothetical protein
MQIAGLALIAVAIAGSARFLALARGTQPVMDLGVPYPTAAAPQSKLWYAHGRWWAWLPVRTGSSIWQRTAAGWERVTALDAWLAELEGFADVWAQGDELAAVVLGDRQLAFAELRFDAELDRYSPRGEPSRWPIPPADPPRRSAVERVAASFGWLPSARSVEAATLARDRAGRFWIAWDERRTLWARASDAAEASSWSRPFPVSATTGEIGGDDVGAVIAVAGGIGVFWSDQNRDAFWFRFHADGSPFDTWSPPELVGRGGGEPGHAQLANNHVFAASGADGSVCIATKTSHYRLGEPVLALWLRSPRGDWERIPYAAQSRERMPTRPIVALATDPPRAELVHEALDRSPWNRHRVDHAQLPLVGSRGAASVPAPRPELLRATLDLRNPTASKAPLPERADWFVLASDRFGHVYEARIPPAP